MVSTEEHTLKMNLKSKINECEDNTRISCTHSHTFTLAKTIKSQHEQSIVN